MTVVNASSSYCYSTLLTVLVTTCSCQHITIPPTPPHNSPFHPFDSQSNEGKQNNKKNSHKNSIFRVLIHCPRIDVPPVDFTHCPETHKQELTIITSTVTCFYFFSFMV
ncbi:hypothetical protein ILYODFUR_004638 [Ilyodon furcidens]|uniref:Uncharacterized protein n=1 Tax=Ilyodon furcidens TaxID=33524 RepID=A0ABV0SIH6_9TELE